MPTRKQVPHRRLSFLVRAEDRLNTARLLPQLRHRPLVLANVPLVAFLEVAEHQVPQAPRHLRPSYVPVETDTVHVDLRRVFDELALLRV